jgi:hypothetical protein
MLNIPYVSDTELIKTANEFLQSLFDFCNDDISVDNDYRRVFSGLFPMHLVLAEMNKCKRIYNELNSWIFDEFIHYDLRPIHQYLLYNLLSQENESDEEMGNIIEYSEEEEDNFEKYFKENIDKARFYMDFLFEDNDFLFYKDFYDTFDSEKFHMMRYDYRITELLPRDKRYELMNIIKKRNKQNKQNNDFQEKITELIEYAKRKIENNQGYKLLWANELHLKENIAQILLALIFDLFCENHNMDISREVNTGRGCVDFKISMGTEKHLIEVKNNSDLVKKGIWKQLKKYLEDENIKFGTLLVLVYSDKELIKLKKISNNEFNINKEVRIKLEIIDARKNKISASKK